MINKFWTLLNRGETCADGRAVTPNTYTYDDKYKELHQFMVPVGEIKYSSYCTEQLLQTITESIYKNELLADDILNTYAVDILSMGDDSYEVIHSTDMQMYVLNESDDDPVWLDKSFSVDIDPTALTATVASSGQGTVVYTFVMTDNLSDKILLSNKLYLPMQGTLPASSFVIGIDYHQKFIRSVTGILSSLENIEIPWGNETYKANYFDDSFPINKLATVSMNLYGLLNGTSD